MLSGSPTIFNLDPYTQSSAQGHQLGGLGMDKYGDFYRYAQVGASNISAGKLQLAPTQKTNHHNCAATAAVAANANNKVTIQLGATAAVANEYAEGYLIANDNSPEGETYRVLNHPAADSAATLQVTIDRLFPTAITTSSEFTLVHNRWNGVVEGTTVTIRAAGVPLIDMTAAYYGWLKTRGVCSVLIGSAATLGADLIVGGTAGSVTDRTDALGASAEPVVAVADIALGVTGEFNPVTLVID
jgi:hypothetical protein